MTKNKTSEAQLKANKRWNEKNKIKVRMSRYRTTARTFMRHYATRTDLEELNKIFENENPNGAITILNEIREYLIGKVFTMKDLEDYIINTLHGNITTSILQDNIIRGIYDGGECMFFYLRGAEFKLIADLEEKSETYKDVKVKIKHIVPTNM